MFKELIIAIVLGSLLGFGITGGYLAIKKTDQSFNKTSITTNNNSPTSTLTPNTNLITNISPTNPPEPTANPQISLVIDSPLNESIVTSSQVTVSGTTTPNSTIIISLSSRHYQVKSDNSGNFKSEIEVDSGVNYIQVDSIDKDDNQVSTQLLVTFSTAKI